MNSSLVNCLCIVHFSLCDFNPKGPGMVENFFHHLFATGEHFNKLRLPGSLPLLKCPEKHGENKLVP